MSETNVNKYRRKHKRCRTCKYSHNYRNYRNYCACTVKNSILDYCDVELLTTKGMFCKLYEPKEFKE